MEKLGCFPSPRSLAVGLLELGRAHVAHVERFLARDRRRRPNLRGLAGSAAPNALRFPSLRRDPPGRFFSRNLTCILLILGSSTSNSVYNLNMLLAALSVFIGTVSYSTFDLSLNFIFIHFDWSVFEGGLMKLLSMMVEVMGHFGGAWPERR